jgi:hypothetical protein
MFINSPLYPHDTPMASFFYPHDITHGYLRDTHMAARYPLVICCKKLLGYLAMKNITINYEK